MRGIFLLLCILTLPAQAHTKHVYPKYSEKWYKQEVESNTKYIQELQKKLKVLEQKIKRHQYRCRCKN